MQNIIHKRKYSVPREVLVSLVLHVYRQSNIGAIASFLCASIIFIGLLPAQETRFALYVWFGFYIFIAASRVFFNNLFLKIKSAEKHITLWRNIYIVGAMLGGFSWGLAAIILLPFVSPSQQTLLVLMLAGVTAGSMPLSSAIPQAAISFLILSIAPFIISIALLRDYIYLLFDIALTIYLMYSIILSTKLYYLVKNSIVLRFLNDELLDNLSKAKQALEMINQKLEHAATHDPLTQVANRTLFEYKLNEAIKIADDNNTLMALFYIDLDHFKKVNDIYGHHVGDLLLIALTERLKKFIKPTDLVARVGGDEFTIILENIKEMATAENVAKRICELLSQPVKIMEEEIRISGSVGISIFPVDGTNANTLMGRADNCMYYVKDQGGNNYYKKESQKV